MSTPTLLSPRPPQQHDRELCLFSFLACSLACNWDLTLGNLRTTTQQPLLQHLFLHRFGSESSFHTHPFTGDGQGKLAACACMCSKGQKSGPHAVQVQDPKLRKSSHTWSDLSPPKYWSSPGVSLFWLPMNWTEIWTHSVYWSGIKWHIHQLCKFCLTRG